jgi:putative transposase
MSTYASLHYHIVFATKRRTPWLDPQWRHQLFEYMGGTVRGLNVFPQGVNGWNDHVHLLIGLKPTHVLSDVVREVKKASSIWIRDTIRIYGFAWQEGYGAFTVGYRERDAIKDYIANQERHHRGKTFTDEIRMFLRDADVEFDPKYLP